MRPRLPLRLDSHPGFKYSLCLLLFVAIWGCSANSWRLLDEPKVDISEPSVIDEELLISVAESPTVNNPEISFSLRKIRTIEYPLRIAKERTVQNYRPSILGWTLGFSAGISAILVSRSSRFDSQSAFSARSSNMYFFSGLAMFGSTFYVLKAQNDPIPTDEVNLLQKSGTTTVVDTVQVNSAIPLPIEVDVTHPSIENGVAILNGEWQEGKYTFDLSSLQWGGIAQLSPSPIEIWITSEMAQFDTLISISDVFSPYVYITTENTPAFIDPQDSNNPVNVITELSEGSKIALVPEESNFENFKVKLGITEAFISSRNCRISWELGEVDLRTVTKKTKLIEFGKISVEREIPKRNEKIEGAVGIIVNSSIDSTLLEYQKRDSRLARAYFTNSFGIPSDRVFEFSMRNISVLSEMLELQAENPFWKGQSKGNVYVYINGETTYTNEKGLLIGSLNDGFIASELFDNLKNHATNSFHLIVESSPTIATSSNPKEFSLFVDNLHRDFSLTSQNTGFFFGSQPNSNQSLYKSTIQEVDFQHFLFTYLFFEAIKQGNHTAVGIKNYLERNLPFKSRSLSERPQVPFIKVGEFDIVVL